MFYVVALLFVWVSVLAAIMSFSRAKWLPTAGAFARFLLIGLFTISCGATAARHGVHGLGASAYKPVLRRVRRACRRSCVQLRRF